MSTETRQLIEVLLALSPWLLFACLIAWSLVSELRDEGGRAEAPRQRRSRREDEYQATRRAA
jgi:hypothetical protein